MSEIRTNWGDTPTERYDLVARKFRPVFERIASGAIERERSRTLPFEQIGWLKELRFGALRVPEQSGGFGLTLPEVFELLTELAAADSNVTQALRAHFGFVEDLLWDADAERREKWFSKIAAGALVGSGWTEKTGGAVVGSFATHVVRENGGWRLNGEKYYTTGSIFADWIEAGVSHGDEVVIALIPTNDPTVSVIDDWNGFGQKLTGSGTARFADTLLPEDHVSSSGERFKYQAGFYQLVHLATIAGILRAAANEVSRQVQTRKRTYSHATSPFPRHDPQVLQVVGKVHAAAYTAGALVQKAARALDRASSNVTGDRSEEAPANVAAELEIAQAQVILADIAFSATSRLFDALGASSTEQTLALDRHWRNIRTLLTHNPLIYKERVIGDYAINGTLPPFLWLAGNAPSDKAAEQAQPAETETRSAIA